MYGSTMFFVEVLRELHVHRSCGQPPAWTQAATRWPLEWRRQAA
jgi:hypothetical protein